MVPAQEGLEEIERKVKEEIDKKKVEELQGGNQFVGNAAEAKEPRRKASTDVGMGVIRPREIRRKFDGMGKLIKRGLKGTREKKRRTRKKTTRKEAQEANAVLSRIRRQKRERRAALGCKVCGQESKPCTKVG